MSDEKTTPTVRSPLRYPGGKSRALKDIMPMVPPGIKEYREPFVGGGSVYFAMRNQLEDNANYWINDLNGDVATFWRMAKEELPELVKRVQHIKDTEHDGRELFERLRAQYSGDLEDIDVAVRFFVLNRITFSGTIEAGGYSQRAFDKRFTLSSIDRLANLAGALDGTQISAQDFAPLLQAPGKGVFIFLDPPYLSTKDSKLYGKRGEYHTEFDHVRFADEMRACKHRWLITYDDSPEVRSLFDFAHIVEWRLQYGMNNYKQEKAAAGSELFVLNYEVEGLTD